MIETIPVPAPGNFPSASHALPTVGCTQPSSIKLQGLDKSASLVCVTATGSVFVGGRFNISTNHEPSPIPLSHTFWNFQHPHDMVNVND